MSDIHPRRLRAVRRPAEQEARHLIEVQDATRRLRWAKKSLLLTIVLSLLFWPAAIWYLWGFGTTIVTFLVYIVIVMGISFTSTQSVYVVIGLFAVGSLVLGLWNIISARAKP
jgi:hypothetical protein